jgi:hypothetical protein
MNFAFFFLVFVSAATVQGLLDWTNREKCCVHAAAPPRALRSNIRDFCIMIYMEIRRKPTNAQFGTGLLRQMMLFSLPCGPIDATLYANRTLRSAHPHSSRAHTTRKFVGKGDQNHLIKYMCLGYEIASFNVGAVCARLNLRKMLAVVNAP